MIPEDEFVDYVENYCNECGYIGNDTPSFIVIDWETTADNFKQDFDEVTHEGYTYYYQQN